MELLWSQCFLITKLGSSGWQCGELGGKPSDRLSGSVRAYREHQSRATFQNGLRTSFLDVWKLGAQVTSTRKSDAVKWIPAHRHSWQMNKTGSLGVEGLPRGKVGDEVFINSEKRLNGTKMNDGPGSAQHGLVWPRTTQAGPPSTSVWSSTW